MFFRLFLQEQNRELDKMIIDISPLISENTAVFPGDVKFKRNISMDFAKGYHFGLSSITSTLHLGAHTDAPSHYHKDGESIDQRSLEIYYGNCQVIEVNLERDKRIAPEDIKNIKIECERVLFKTNSFPDPDNWNADFNSLSPELIQYLSKNGVLLVGIDTPSVDPSDAKELSSHLKIHELNLAILEGIILNHVEEGKYKLIALPLKIKDADASPVRAVLIRE